MLKLTNILTEAKSDALTKKLFSKLTIEGGAVKLYHYSANIIKDKNISITGKQGSQSNTEYKIWSRPRAFFYGREDGYIYDSGINTKYKYISHIPVDKIYPVAINPNNYKSTDGNVFEAIYQQASSDGYTAFIYYLNKNPKCPIVVSMIDVKIDEAYVKTEFGVYVPITKKIKDFPIGEIVIDGEKLYIMAKDGYLPSINNTYLSDNKNGSGFQRYFDEFRKRDGRFYPEYKGTKWTKN
jgi:hypothetical protein